MEEVLKIIEKNQANCYCYGSIVYGTNNINSDRDFIVVSDSILDFSQLKNTDVKLISFTEFNQSLLDHEIWAIECIMLKEKFKRESVKIEFKINKEKLRKEISSKSSNSWVKAKKKIEKEGEIYIGEKSLWHSIRILDFGIQLAQSNRIVDFSAVNDLYPKIVGMNKSWGELNQEFKTIYNEKHSLFKKICPKVS